MSWHECKYLFKKEGVNSTLFICRNRERIEAEGCKPYCKRRECGYCRI